MSQLRQSARSSYGELKIFSGLTWSEVVQVILILTIEAYQQMRQAKIARPGWEENQFTINLEDFLRPVALDREIPLFVHSRTKVHTQAMKAGEERTIKAKEMDLWLHGTWENYDVKHFVWEAKLVGDKRVNLEYDGLSSEYVNEAIYRFIRGEYASQVSDAGVLGYVLAGDVGNIVADINQSMGNIRKSPPLLLSNHLRRVESINGFRDVYQSDHDRAEGVSIRLHHLFLTFDFT